MAYRTRKIPDLRLVKAFTYSPLTIDLGQEFGGTVKAFIKKDGDDSHYREFTVTDGRYLSLTRSQTIDLEDEGEIYEIEGRWYLNVWRYHDEDGETEDEAEVIYTGKILFIKSMSAYAGTEPEDIIWFFQFDSVSDDINNIDLIDQDFLDTYGQQFGQSELGTGQDIVFNLLGRYGFTVDSASTNPYTFYDVLGNDITDTLDYVNQDGVSYYVAQEFSVPSTVYFKAEKK